MILEIVIAVLIGLAIREVISQLWGYLHERN